MSFVSDRMVTAGTIVRGVGISIHGIFFDGSTATYVSGGAGCGNPYN